MNPRERSPSSGSARVRWGSAGLFFALAIGLAWVLDLPLWLDERGLARPAATVLTAISMFAPAVAALLVVTLVQRAPRRSILHRLGWRPVRPLRHTCRYVLIGVVVSLLMPVVVVFIGAGLGSVDLDLVHFSGFAEDLAASLPAGTDLPPIGVPVAVQIVSLPVAAIVNGLLTMGRRPAGAASCCPRSGLWARGPRSSSAARCGASGTPRSSCSATTSSGRTRPAWA